MEVVEGGLLLLKRNRDGTGWFFGRSITSLYVAFLLAIGVRGWVVESCVGLG